MWWSGPTTWRVSTLRTTGETDLIHAGDRMLRWVYESKNVTLVPDVSVRLPNTADLLPNELARRVLSGARSGELSRLPARRVAGHDTLGLRLRPADPQSAVSRVDVYADAATGLPVQVQLYAKGQAFPSLTTRFVDLHVGEPDRVGAGVLAAGRLPGPHRRRRRPRRRRQPVRRPGPAPEARRSAGPRHPDRPARFRRRLRARAHRAVRGAAVAPQRRPGAREPLPRRPARASSTRGFSSAAPPIRLLLADAEPNDNSWLLAGTVTRKALLAAADQLAAKRPGLRVP